jgi:hypothetical protein
MARLLLGLVAALIIAFAVWAAIPSTPPLAQPTTRTTAAVTPPAPAPAGGGDLEPKIAGCLAAQRQVADARAQRGGPAPAGQPSDAAVVARGCAPLYREAACRDAMMHFDDPPPPQRSITVLKACAHAYCGILTAPKPSVCDHPDAVPEDEQQFAAWNDLRTAILTHDIGAAAAQRVLAPPPDRGAR